GRRGPTRPGGGRPRPPTLEKRGEAPPWPCFVRFISLLGGLCEIIGTEPATPESLSYPGEESLAVRRVWLCGQVDDQGWIRKEPKELLSLRLTPIPLSYCGRGLLLKPSRCISFHHATGEG